MSPSSLCCWIGFQASAQSLHRFHADGSANDLEGLPDGGALSVSPMGIV